MTCDCFSAQPVVEKRCHTSAVSSKILFRNNCHSTALFCTHPQLQDVALFPALLGFCLFLFATAGRVTDVCSAVLVRRKGHAEQFVLLELLLANLFQLHSLPLHMSVWLVGSLPH